MSQALINFIAQLSNATRRALNVEVTDSKTGKQASDTITLAHDTAAHHALDVVSTAAGEILEFPLLGAAGDLICILGTRMKYAVNAIPTAHAGYNLHLFNAAPTVIADNAAFNVIAADVGKYIGYISIPALTGKGDNCFSQSDNDNVTAKLVGTSLYGVLQCIAAETPTIDAVYTILLNAAGI